MGLALFYGSQAESHADATHRWRQLWLAEDELAQRDRQMEMDRQLQEAQLEVQKDAHKLQTRAQAWAEKQQEIENSLNRDVFDADVASAFFESEDEWFDSATPVQRAEMISNWETLMGDNQFAAPYISTRKQRMADAEMTDDSALEMISQYVNPTMPNAQGDYDFVPEFMVDRALKHLKDVDYWGYDDILEAVDARREPNEETAHFLEQANLDKIGLNISLDEAELEGRELANEYSRLELDELPKQFAREAEKARLDMVQQGIDIEDAETRQEYLRDFLDAELDTMLVGIAETELAMDFLERRMPAELRALAAEAGIAEEELEFKVATQATRIMREDLTTEQLERMIDKLDLDIEEQEVGMQRERHSFAMSLVGAGQTSMLRLYGDELFGDLDEEARKGLIDDLATISDSNMDFSEREREAKLNLTIAQTHDAKSGGDLKAVQAQYYPEVIAQGWEDLNIKRFAAETARQQGLLKAMTAGPVGMSPHEAFDDAMASMGVDANYLNDKTAALDEMERDVKLLDELIAGGGDINDIKSLQGRLEEYGFHIPDFGERGEWSPEALQSVRDDLQSFIADEEKLTAGVMTTLQIQANARSNTPISVPDMLGMVVPPHDPDDPDSMDRNARIYTMFMGNSPEAQAAEWQEYQDDLDAGIITEAMHTLMPHLSVAVTKLATNSAGNGLEVALSDADTLFEMLIDTEYEGTHNPEAAAEALEYMGISSPSDLINSINASVDGQRRHSMSVYNYVGTGEEMDLSSPQGLSYASAKVDRDSEVMQDLMYSKLPQTIDALGDLQGLVQTSAIYTPSEAEALQEQVVSEANRAIDALDEMFADFGGVRSGVYMEEVIPFGPAGSSGPTIEVPMLDGEYLSGILRAILNNAQEARDGIDSLIFESGGGLAPEVASEMFNYPALEY